MKFFYSYFKISILIAPFLNLAHAMDLGEQRPIRIPARAISPILNALEENLFFLHIGSPNQSVKSPRTSSWEIQDSLTNILPSGIEKIADVSALPYLGHGCLRMKYSNYIEMASGVLIDNCHVLTVAHAVYRYKDVLPERITFYRALKGKKNPEEIEADGVMIAVHPEWYTHKANKHQCLNHTDIAIVKLKNNLDFNQEYFLNCQDCQLDSNCEDIILTSYAEKVDRGRQMFNVNITNKVNVSDENMLLYEVETYGGQSGGGIWTRIRGHHCYLGLHTEEIREGNGQGVYLNSRVKEEICRWRRSTAQYSQAHMIPPEVQRNSQKKKVTFIYKGKS